MPNYIATYLCTYITCVCTCVCVHEKKIEKETVKPFGGRGERSFF